LEGGFAVSGDAGKPVTERFNAALRLYECLGFRPIADRGVSWLMERPAGYVLLTSFLEPDDGAGEVDHGEGAPGILVKARAHPPDVSVANLAHRGIPGMGPPRARLPVVGGASLAARHLR